MTETEKKYAEAYKRMKNEGPDGELSSQQWKDLGKYREELGLSIGAGTRVTRHIDECDFIHIHPMHQLGDVQLSNFTFEADDPYKKLMEEVELYEVYINDIMTQTQSLLDKTDELASKINGYAEFGAEYATKSYKKGDTRAAALVGGATLLVGLATIWYQHNKKAEIDAKMQQQMAKLQEQKKQMANLKLPNIYQQHEKFMEMAVKTMSRGLDREFNKTVQVGEQADMSVKMFKRTFLIKVKLMYFNAIFDYIEDEMKAWQNGLQSSDNLRPLVAESIDNEVLSWFESGKLSRKELSGIVNNSVNAAISLPYYFMLSEPYIMRRHVGVALSEDTGLEYDMVFDWEHYETPIIKQLSTSIEANCYGNEEDFTPLRYFGDIKKKSGIWEVIKNNSYFNRCFKSVGYAHSEMPSITGYKVKIIILYITLTLVVLALNPLIGLCLAVADIFWYRKAVKQKSWKMHIEEKFRTQKAVLEDVNDIETNLL